MMKKCNKNQKNCRFRKISAGIVLLSVGFFLYHSAKWYIHTYGALGFDAVLYTLTADMSGVDSGLIRSFAEEVLPATFFGVLFWGVFLFFSSPKKLVLRIRGRYGLRIYPLRKSVGFAGAVVISLLMIAAAAKESEFINFIYCIRNPSTLYETEYIDPKTAQIEFPEKKRNLIYIYLESMETAFQSQELGGALPYNTIPELTQLARDNISFSQHDQIGGFLATSGTTWTIASLVGQSAGIPLKLPPGVNGNDYGQDGSFLPGVVGLTDLLHENGYRQAVMFGSEAAFGGRLQYYMGHNVDRVYDLETAWADGIVPDGYDNGFWGMEDLYLFEYAKQVLPEMAAGEAPFAFAMLTVDTHHINGYVCSLCEQTYDAQYENVYSCTSAQTHAFVQWLQEQPFYENTTIIIAGDHPSMDGAYIEQHVDAAYDRRVYNCIINSAVETDRQKFREFCAFDMFPTTLSAMGCRIEGDRLGLGTDLFSEEATLLEKMGRDRFTREVARFSEFYATKFYGT